MPALLHRNRVWLGSALAALAVAGGCAASTACGGNGSTGRGAASIPDDASAARSAAAAPNAMCPEAPPTHGGACTGTVRCRYPSRCPRVCACAALPTGRGKAWNCRDACADGG
jgi:hypothetical protein